MVAAPAGDVLVNPSFEFSCPDCLAAQLQSANDGGLSCAACGRRFSVRDGIPVFQNRPADFYWGVPTERMREMLDEAARIGWHDAMLRLCRELPPPQADLLWLRSFGYRRGAVQMLLPMGPNARVLDFGCGWGAISLHLAARAGHVVAMDQSSLHLEWVRAASRQRGLTNVTLVQGGDTRHLPFPADSFDAVVLNGVLEHVAVNRSGEPRAAQRQFLSECARVLKPSGVVYIGIENRLNYKYFLGVREGHIHMKFGALLPRWMTHWYLMRTRKRPYREYTYSLWGYRRLLRDAGFVQQRFFAPWPTYGTFGEFFPVQATRDTATWDVDGTHPASRVPGWFFTRAYSIVGSKGTPQPVLVEEILTTIAAQTGRDLPWKLKGQLFKATSGGKITIRATGRGTADWLIQIGVTPLSARRIASQYAAMTALTRAALPDRVKRRIPVPIATGDYKGYFFGVRPFTDGVRAATLSNVPERRTLLCDEALSFLCDFQIALGRRVTVDESWLEKLVRAPFDSVRQWFTSAEWSDGYGAWFAEQQRAVEEQLRGQTLPVVPSHGDFVPDNCIWDEASNALAQIIDWELYDDVTLPLIDWVSFIGAAYASDMKAAARARGEDPAHLRFHGYPEAYLHGSLAPMLSGYLDRMQIDRHLLPPLLFMWWIRQMHDWAPLLLYYPDWRRLRVLPLVERWKAVFAQASN